MPHQKSIAEYRLELEEAQNKIKKLERQKMIWMICAIVFGVLFVLVLALKLVLM